MALGQETDRWRDETRAAFTSLLLDKFLKKWFVPEENWECHRFSDRGRNHFHLHEEEETFTPVRGGWTSRPLRDDEESGVRSQEETEPSVSTR